MSHHHIHVEIVGVPVLVNQHDFASRAVAGICLRHADAVGSDALNGLGAKILLFGELVEGSTVARRRRDEICRLSCGRMVYRSGYVHVPIGIKVGIVPGLRVIEMNAYGGWCSGKVRRHKRTENIVDSAPAIPARVPEGLETLNLSIRPDDRSVYLDDAGERRIRYRSDEDTGYILG